MIPPFAQIDFEVTNRCNAKCHFCPRDKTPHQGLMSPEVFEAALGRAVEFRDAFASRFDLEVRVALCGLGEPLLNRHVADYARAVTDQGFYCSVSTNGSLLDEVKGRALLEAGIRQIDINVGDLDEEYDEVYRLPFETTRDNVVRFVEMAGDRCRVQVVVVDHRGDPTHSRRVVDYWRERGVAHFLPYPIMNRGGAYEVDAMAFAEYAESDQARELLATSLGRFPVCPAPFIFQFIGYDGQHYLCCSDWTKLTPMGSVFDTGFVEVFDAKIRYVTSGEPVCRTCNHDPFNRVTADLREVSTGAGTRAQVDATVEDIRINDGFARSILERFGTAVPTDVTPSAPPRRTLIPVRVDSPT